MAAERGPVLVTGGSGFLGSHVVKLLLDKGFTVRTTVRNVEDDAKTGYLRKLRADGAQLELVEVDLLSADDHWQAAMSGCSSVMHVASPVSFTNETEEELIDPAVRGTEAVMRAAIAAGSVRRVVLTSSGAAVRYKRDIFSSGLFTESDWSDVSACPSAYAKSKTLAERTAWDLSNGAEAELELVTICPTLILGPPLFRGSAHSIGLVLSMMNGSVDVVRDTYFGIVDVRDVAQAHLEALIRKSAGGQRFILNLEAHHFNDIADAVRREVEPLGYRTPRNCTVQSRRPRDVSGAKAREQLGIVYRSFEVTVRDMVHQLIKLGYVEPPTEPTESG